MRFSSRSEWVIGTLCEKYIPKWECIPGETLHVKVGDSEIDFRFPALRTWLEYHPIRLRHEFKDASALHRITEALRRTKKHVRDEIIRGIQDELKAEYYLSRRKALNRGFPDDSLIVAHDSTEFYRYVIKPFGQSVPSEHDFLREWGSLIRRAPF